MEFTDRGIEFSEQEAVVFGQQQEITWSDAADFLDATQENIWQAHLDVDELVLARNAVSDACLQDISRRIALLSGVYDEVQTAAIARGVLPQNTAPRNLIPS